MTEAVRIQPDLSRLQRNTIHFRGEAPEGIPFWGDTRIFQNEASLPLRTDLGDGDILGVASGAENFEELWKRSTLTEADDLRVQVASGDDLISRKRAANRPKDQNHLLELLAIQKFFKRDD